MREEVISVGIDIGTATTQLVFSKITVENIASNFSIPRVTIVDKEIVYRSNIYFTPLISMKKINGSRIREIIEEEYRLSGFTTDEINTGAVIITGETARKDNASNVLEMLSGLAGDFVVATAGPDLESIIAGKGSGADKLSKDKKAVVVNLDIGGGTTNLAVFENGELIDTGCLDIGGRLIKINKNHNKISYIAPKVKKLAEEIGVHIEEGMKFNLPDVDKIITKLVDLMMESIEINKRSNLYEMIITNKGIKKGYQFDYVTFSGGVADYIYSSDHDDLTKFGDIGILLGKKIKEVIEKENISLYKSDETIRATVVGAASHTTDISGSTITYDESVLPVKNLPILKLSSADENNGYENLSKAISEKVRWFDLENEMQQMAIAIKGMDRPTFKGVQELAKAIIEGLNQYMKNDFPIFIVVENDISKVLGQSINSQLKHSHKVVCIDSVYVQNGDYIDIGYPIVNGRVVPVVIKTLVLNS